MNQTKSNEMFKSVCWALEGSVTHAPVSGLWREPKMIRRAPGQAGVGRLGDHGVDGGSSRHDRELTVVTVRRHSKQGRVGAGEEEDLMGFLGEFQPSPARQDARGECHAEVSVVERDPNACLNRLGRRERCHLYVVCRLQTDVIKQGRLVGRRRSWQITGSSSGSRSLDS